MEIYGYIMLYCRDMMDATIIQPTIRQLCL